MKAHLLFGLLLLGCAFAVSHDSLVGDEASNAPETSQPLPPLSGTPVPPQGADECAHMRTNLKPATVFVLILLVFAFFVQIILHFLEKYLNTREQLAKMIRAVYNELLLLGLIGLLIFISNRTPLTEILSRRLAAWGTMSGTNERLICVPSQIVGLLEKVHLGIFATIGIYILTCVWLIVLHVVIYKHWIRIDDEPFNLLVYRSLLSRHNQTPFFLRYFHLPRLYQLHRMRSSDRLQAMRLAIIEHFGLPRSFPISIYFKFAMRDVVIRVLQIHPICWAALILSFGFTYVRISVMRVDNSTTTVIIYSLLSFLFTLLSILVLYSANKIYRKVLTFAAVRRHLHIRDEFDHLLTDHDAEHALLSQHNRASQDSNFSDVGTSMLDPEPEQEETFSLLDSHRVPTTRLSQGISAILDSENASSSNLDTADQRDAELGSPVNAAPPSSMAPMSSASYSTIMSSGEYGTSGAVDERDDDVRSFEDLHPGTRLKFDVFNRHHAGDTMTIMSVSEYREMSRMVTHMFKKSQMPTKDDLDHKGMLFFRSRYYLVYALQLITFFQSWVLGLAIYFSWSIYHDYPYAPLRTPALFLLLAAGPLLTYILLGFVLATVVKATYTGGLVRIDLILETLFRPDRSSDAHSSTLYTEDTKVSQMKNWKRMRSSKPA